MFFEDIIKARVPREIILRVEKIIQQDRGNKYDNISHFVRCSILKNLSEEEKK